MKEKLNSNLRAISLKQLRVLKAVVARGSISGAAQILSVTPPAITLQMKLFEQSVGLPLVQRINKKLRPTDAGRLLLESANRIEETLAECGNALEALSGIERGRVAVGVIGTAKYFAPKALAHYQKAHRKVDMRLTIGNRQEMIAALENYDLDLAIMGRPPAGEYRVDANVIGDHPHIIIAPPDHHKAAKKKISVIQLAGETFLLREEGSGTRLLMQRLFAQQGMAPNLGLQIGSNETIKQAVIAGLGIAMISAHTVAAELADGRLIALNVTGMPVVRKWYVVKRSDKRLLPAAQSLWDFLSSSGKDYLPKFSSGI